MGGEDWIGRLGLLVGCLFVCLFALLFRGLHVFTSVWNLDGIARHLDLSGNALERLPRRLVLCKALSFLDLADNNGGRVPVWFSWWLVLFFCFLLCVCVCACCCCSMRLFLLTE